MSFRILTSMVLCLVLSSAPSYGFQSGSKQSKSGRYRGRVGSVVNEEKSSNKSRQKPLPFPVERNDDDPLPPPPPPKARLALAMNAVGAEVWINGKLRGKTKENGTVLIDLRTINRTIKAIIIVRHPDFEEFTRDYVLKRGYVAVDSIELTSKYGKVVLAGIPENAQVFIDEVERTIDSTLPTDEIEGIKKEDVTIERVDVGIHKLKIRHPDYITWEGELEVKPFTTVLTYFTPSLKLATARLTIKALPGAKVYLDGVEKGEIPKDGKLIIGEISMRRQKPEGYEITVSKPGFVEAKSIRKLNIGDNGTLEVDLKPIPASLSK